MSLSTISGNKIGIYIDGDSDGGTGTSRLVGLSTSASMSYSNNVIETAAKNGVAAISTLHSIAGTGSFSFSVDGLIDITTDADDYSGTAEHGFNNLAKLAIAGSTVEVVFKSDSGTTYTGEAFIESLEATAGVDSFASYTCSLKGTGALTQATS